MAPKRSSDPLEQALIDRIMALATSTDESAREIHRTIVSGSDGGPPTELPYQRVWRWVRAARTVPRSASDPTAEGMAGRILRLLSAELERIERSSAKLDLSRLDQIAATLRRVEPIRPKAGKREAATLQRLAGQQTYGLDGAERDEDLSEAQPQIEPASLDQLR